MLETTSRLTDEDWDDLEAWLERIELGRFQRTLGLMHAIAVAPNLLEPSRWLPLVIAGYQFETQEEATSRLGLVLRAVNEVRALVATDRTYAPDETCEPDDCAHFASGFVLGADLDPAWLEDELGRSYALAFLPLVPTATPADFDTDVEEFEARRMGLREKMGAVVVSAFRDFAVKRGAGFIPNRRGPVRSARVGRNEPCTCGSGRKFKKCCGGIATA